MSGTPVILHRCLIPSPVGTLVAVANGESLVALEFDGPGQLGRFERRIRQWVTRQQPIELLDRPDPILDLARQWVETYFSHPGSPLPEVPLEPPGSAFEQRVWSALRRIPPGTTTSYGVIAREIGSENGARAVGLANGANPLALIVPCHRVIGADGSLVGYGGGLEPKRWLLDHERQWRRDSLF